MAERQTSILLISTEAPYPPGADYGPDLRPRDG